MITGISIAMGSTQAIPLVIQGIGAFEAWAVGGQELPIAAIDGVNSGNMEKWPKAKELPPVVGKR